MNLALINVDTHKILNFFTYKMRLNPNDVTAQFDQVHIIGYKKCIMYVTFKFLAISQVQRSMEIISLYVIQTTLK